MKICIPTRCLSGTQRIAFIGITDASAWRWQVHVQGSNIDRPSVLGVLNPERLAVRINRGNRDNQRWPTEIAQWHVHAKMIRYAALFVRHLVRFVVAAGDDMPVGHQRQPPIEPQPREGSGAAEALVAEKRFDVQRDERARVDARRGHLSLSIRRPTAPASAARLRL
ncbi:hypothetical protein [Sphingobium chungangianum]